MRTIFSFGLLLAGVVAGWGQGYVDFRNFGPVFYIEADRRVRDVDGTLLVGNNFVAQLYWDRGTSNVGNANLFGTSVTNPPVPFRSPTTTAPGYWVFPGGTSFFYVIGYGEGERGTLQVRAWDSNFGMSFEEAVLNGGKWGVSIGFEYLPPGPDPPGAYAMQNLRGFTLVPEPSVYALSALSTLIVYLCARFMRKKSRPAWDRTLEDCCE